MRAIVAWLAEVEQRLKLVHAKLRRGADAVEPLFGASGSPSCWSDYLGVEQPVNAQLGLGHGLFLPECQGTQSRSGKQR